jgi:hypothetical protein
VFLPLPTGGAADCLAFDLVLEAGAGLSFATGATETRGLLAELVDGALTTGSTAGKWKNNSHELRVKDMFIRVK